MGTCSIRILMFGLLLNVCNCRGTHVGFETAKSLPCVSFYGCHMQLSLAKRAWTECVYIYIFFFSEYVIMGIVSFVQCNNNSNSNSEFIILCE